ncbi:carboxymuconolactone decarboxylase family protein [Mycobacterium rhizamassiliense]|jgi:AhpD family alkylhydroperoxidase|nr:carboxymuconolactone decarboxylase family protein [Mycobacterium rhizamassiliense]
MSERLDYAAVSPRGVKALGGVHLYVSQSGLLPGLVTTVYLRVSLINGCAYCIDMHSRELRDLGVSNEKIALVPVWQEAGELFDARERAALAWAETVTRISETGAPDSAYAAASEVFDDKELVDLTLAIGVMNAYNRLAVSFRNPPASAVAKRAE